MSQAVVRQIETLVLQGVLRPGDRLPSERELAQRLDVSRPTLREALAELEDRGLVSCYPGGGTFVAEDLGTPFSPALVELFGSHEIALHDYIAFRRDLEGMAAERAALVATEADLDVVRSVFVRLEAANAESDREAEAAIDAEFHLSIVEAAHNLVMVHVMRALSGLLVRGVFYNRGRVYGLAEGRERLMAQHRAIHDAVVARRGAEARAAVEAHLDYVGAAVRMADLARTREEVAELRRRYEASRTERSRSRRGLPRRGMEAAE